MKAVLFGTLAATASLAAPAAAQHHPMRDGSGTTWRVTTNDHGAVLRSRRDTLYLGRSCEARSARLGRGRWEWANGGVLIVFPHTRIGFPRQELDAGQGQNCRS